MSALPLYWMLLLSQPPKQMASLGFWSDMLLPATSSSSFGAVVLMPTFPSLVILTRSAALVEIPAAFAVGENSPVFVAKSNAKLGAAALATPANTVANVGLSVVLTFWFIAYSSLFPFPVLSVLAEIFPVNVALFVLVMLSHPRKPV